MQQRNAQHPLSLASELRPRHSSEAFFAIQLVRIKARLRPEAAREGGNDDSGPPSRNNTRPQGPFGERFGTAALEAWPPPAASFRRDTGGGTAARHSHPPRAAQASRALRSERGPASRSRSNRGAHDRFSKSLAAGGAPYRFAALPPLPAGCPIVQLESPSIHVRTTVASGESKNGAVLD